MIFDQEAKIPQHSLGHSEACVTSNLLRANTKVTFSDISCLTILFIFRSMAATVPEQSQLLVPGLMSGDQAQAQETVDTALTWSRLLGQVCRIPTHLLHTIESGAR